MRVSPFLVSAAVGIAQDARALDAYCEADVATRMNIAVEDDYLPHVVACENGAADFEALRAQAIAARTYLYYKLETSGSIGDGQGDQVYTCGREPEMQHYEAARSTSGEVLTYSQTIIAAFYVAGAIPSSEDCVALAGDPDSHDTEKYVTYNQGRSGDDVIQTTLGFVDPSNLRNRGAKSQNGANCLSRRGFVAADILAFYYGMDIAIERADGACVAPEASEACAVGGKSEAFVDDASACVVRACTNMRVFTAIAGGFGGTMQTLPAADTESCTARWQLSFIESGDYSISAHVKGASPRASNALYRVLHAGVEDEVVVDQARADEWAPLGSYRFEAGADQYVELSDRVEGNAAPGALVVVDAIRVRKAGVLPPQPIIREMPPAEMDPITMFDQQGCGCTAAPGSRLQASGFWALLGLLLLVGCSSKTALELGAPVQSDGIAACVDDGTDGVPHDGYRCATYRGIGGISMGGGAAMRIALEKPELFDVAVSLGSPYIDLEYFLLSVSAVSSGGFCPLDQLLQHMDKLDVKDDPDTWCGPVHFDAPALENSACGGFSGDYNHHYRGTPAGRGGGFGRQGSFDVVHDFAFAYGNPAFTGGPGDYLPPGVDASWHVPLELEGQAQRDAWADRCTHKQTIHNFYDRNYNPDGHFDVITYCDGEGPVNGEYEPGTEIFPVEVTVAVDLNGNGRRDYAEPVITRGFEPYDDFGVDNTKDENEPGYDPVTNKDPAGDDYDWLANPKGSERNSRPDPGEHFEDVGLDGVADTHDTGEGDGVYTINTNIEHTFEQSPRHLLELIDDRMLGRLHLWMDAGIRDFLFSAQITNQFYGALSTRTPNTKLLRGFDGDYDARTVDLSEGTVGRHAYLRYGDESFCPGVDEVNGSGNHVGTPKEVLFRLETCFAFASARLDGGDRKTMPELGGTIEDFVKIESFHSEALGRDIPYVVILPPDYHQSPDARYPVMYFLHGQGQKATDLAASALLLLGPQMSSDEPDRKRAKISDWQKMLIVLADGECQLGECHTGTFYLDHRGVDHDGKRFGEAFFELMRLVDATYRTKAPEMLDSSPQ